MLLLSAINVSCGMSEALQANRIRDIAALRWFLEDKDLEELATHHGVKVQSLKDAVRKLSTLLYFRARDRTGLTKVPSSIRVMKKDAAFWLQKLNDNEDRLRVLDPDKLPD